VAFFSQFLHKVLSLLFSPCLNSTLYLFNFLTGLIIFSLRTFCHSQFFKASSVSVSHTLQLSRFFRFSLSQVSYFFLSQKHNLLGFSQVSSFACSPRFHLSQCPRQFLIGLIFLSFKKNFLRFSGFNHISQFLTGFIFSAQPFFVSKFLKRFPFLSFSQVLFSHDLSHSSSFSLYFTLNLSLFLIHFSFISSSQASF
jgi:hypothetical protein